MSNNKFTNYIAISRETSAQEDLLLEIVNEAMDCFRVEKLMTKYIKYDEDHSILRIGKNIVDLAKKKIYVLGFGKAAGKMAEVFEEIIPPRKISKGLVVTIPGIYISKKIKIVFGGHPYPNHDSYNAAKEILSFAKKLKETDIVICLVSGGGSALMAAPSLGVSLRSKIATTKLLILRGVREKEINIVRKHLSRIKGGKLARFLYPSTIYNLFISDNIHGNLSLVASGPTVSDRYTFRQALHVLKKYRLLSSLPNEVTKYLSDNLGRRTNETPKERSKFFKSVHNQILLDNRKGLKMMRHSMRKHFDYIFIHPRVFDRDLKSSLKNYQDYIVSKIDSHPEKNFVVLASGEIAIRVTKNSRGGRMQHLSCLMIPFTAKYKQSVFIGLATDGRDFLPGIAGAMINSKTRGVLSRKGIDMDKYLRRTNTYVLLKKIRSLLFTKMPTQTNIADIYIYAYFGKQEV